MSFFLLVLWLGICVEVDVERITYPHRLPVFFPTHNTSDSYLKWVRAWKASYGAV